MKQWDSKCARYALLPVLAALPLFACAADAGGVAPSSSSMNAGPTPAPCVEPDSGLPTDVYCTGLYAGRDATRYDPAVMPYTPGVTLWSDGAEKHRYLYLPPSAQIDTSTMDVWKFPVGTKAWKEFKLDGKLIETRLFWKRDGSTWESGTYIWDSEGKTATLNTSRTPVVLANGYEIPTAKDCGKCHHGGADKLLGIEAVALALPSASGVTLTSLVLAGSLSQPPPTTTISLPEDSTGKAGWALGYLHANCGMPCHSSRGLGHETELVMRLRADEFWPVPLPVAMTDIYTASLNKEPVTEAVASAFPGAFRITPGSHDKSLVWLLAHRRGEYQMPPLVSHKVDEPGMQRLADWIDALAP
jgi:hypothetical protein